MKHRILTGVVVLPLLIVLTTTPAYAIFGSILAGIQRAQMIANQGIQIYKDTMAKITFDGQLTQMTDQFAHLKEQALGGVGALTRSVHRLGFRADAIYRSGPIVEERLYRDRPGRGVERRNHGRERQELPGIVGAAAHRRRHGDGERRDQSLCRLSTGDRGAGFKPVSRGGGKTVTSAWCSITPRATLRRISWLPRKPPWSLTRGCGTTPTRPTPRLPNRRLPER